MSKQSILRGTLIIAITGLIARFIGLFFRIPLTAILGGEGIGIYSFPSTLFVPLSAIVLIGPPTVIAKMISEANALNEKERLYEVHTASRSLLIKLGLFTSLVMILLIPILFTFFWSEDVFYPYLALTLTPIILSVTSAYIGYYQGLEKMHMIAIQQVSDGVGRAFFGILLAALLMPYGLIYAATGGVLGTTFGAVIALVALTIANRRSEFKPHHVSIDKIKRKIIEKEILTKAVPITIGAVGASLIPFIDVIFVRNRLAPIGFSEEEIFSLSGILSNVNTLVSVPLIIGVSISMSIIPNIASTNVINQSNISNRIRSGLILTVSLALPAGIGLFLVGTDLFELLYSSLSSDHYLMQILGLNTILIMINQSFIAILQGLGLEKIPVKNFYKGMIMKIILAYILLGVETINIHGAALSTMAAYFIIFVLNFIDLKRHVKFKIDFKYTVLIPVFNTLIMAILVYLTQESLMASGTAIRIMLSVLVGGLVYAVLLVVTKIVSLKSIPVINRFIK